MTRVQKLKQMLNQNITARLFLYAAALIMPVVMCFEFNQSLYCPIEEIGFVNVMWLGFYSSLLLLWACFRKPVEKVISGILALLNMVLILSVVVVNAATYGIWLGVLGIFLAVIPFANFYDGIFFSLGIGEWGFLFRCIVFLAIVGLVLYLNGDWQERWNKKQEENNKEEMV